MTPSSSFKAFVRRWFSVLVLSVLSAGAAHAAPTLTLVSGKLTGATGVDVGGVLYDVEFKRGSCFSVFAGCASVSDFVFQSPETALAASVALLDQVFVNTSDFAIDDNPQFLLGCILDRRCTAYTPFRANNATDTIVQFAGAENRPPAAMPRNPDRVFTAAITDFETEMPEDVVWAVWSRTAYVAEPSSLALLGFAGVALGWSQRRRRHRARALAQ